MRRIPLLVLPLLLIAMEAEAQVLLTELQPNPMAPFLDAAEWVELHNTGTVDADISGYTINDFGPATPRQYAFPAGTVLTPGQVIIATRQAAEYTAMATALGFAVVTPNFEFDFGATDEPTVPNMPIVVMGTGAWGLVNNGSDGVLVRDSLGVYVDGVEYGTTDRAEIPGLPQSTTAADGQTLSRVSNLGSSIFDFLAGAPTPGIGFAPPPNMPPVVTNVVGAPRHMFAGDPLTVTANAADTDPITVSLYTAIATSSAGAANGMYTPTSMTATTPPGYTGTFSPIVVVPATFHDSYIRFYVQASDASGSNTDPANATPDATNTEYIFRNLMPVTPSSIAEVRAQNANEIPLYRYHSATIEGIALTRGIAFVPNRTNFFMRNLITGEAIRVFSTELIPENVVEGDVVRVTGMIDVFNGLRQIGEPSIDVTIIGAGPPTVPPMPQTIGQVIAAGEALEGQVVYVGNVSLVGMPATWPANGNVDITDGADTLAVRITSIVDLSGQPAPQGAFDLQGILGQFSNTGIGGYQLLPRGATDVFGVLPPVDAGVDDSGVDPDATGVDTGEPPIDGGMEEDSGVVPPDSGVVPPDTGVVPPDSGAPPPPDSGMTGDDDGGVIGGDAGPSRSDTGAVIVPGGREESGCGCATSESPNTTGTSVLALALLGLALVTRRKR